MAVFIQPSCIMRRLHSRFGARLLQIPLPPSTPCSPPPAPVKTEMINRIASLLGEGVPDANPAAARTCYQFILVRSLSFKVPDYRPHPVLTPS